MQKAYFILMFSSWNYKKTPSLSNVSLAWCLFGPHSEQQPLQLWTFEEQGWCCGESTRLPPVWPGFSPLLPEVFLWALRFSQTLSNLNPLLKNQDSTNTSKFQFNLEHTDMFKLVYKNSYVILEFKTYYNLQFTGSQLNWDFTRELSLHPWCLLSKSLW